MNTSIVEQSLGTKFTLGLVSIKFVPNHETLNGNKIFISINSTHGPIEITGIALEQLAILLPEVITYYKNNYNK